MKKIYLTLAVAISLIASKQIIGENNETNSTVYNDTKDIILADARFSQIKKLKYDVDLEMITIFRVLKNDKNLSQNELKQLISKIEILKTWGSDMSIKSKKILNHLVKILKIKESYDEKIIKKLENLSKFSAIKYS